MLTVASDRMLNPEALNHAGEMIITDSPAGVALSTYVNKVSHHTDKVPIHWRYILTYITMSYIMPPKDYDG